ncbi:hypothetical protein ACU4GD_24785 [Cupriavidus basilensis]
MSATGSIAQHRDSSSRAGRHGIFRVTAAHDADEHASNPVALEPDLRPASCSRPPPARSCDAGWLPHAQAPIERTSRSLRQSCMAWPDARWPVRPLPLPSVHAPATVGGIAIAPHGHCRCAARRRRV